MLSPSIEPWSREAVLASISPRTAPLLRLLQIDELVTSTNDAAAARLRERGCSGVVCLAEEQSAGRGRRGRAWLSPAGQSIYLSMGWVFSGSVSGLQGLSLAVGVAVANALESFGVNQVMLKWPNDLMVRGSKLGGVLVELHSAADGQLHVVVGVGLNLRMPEDTSQRLGRAVVDLMSVTDVIVSRNELGARLIDEIAFLLSTYAVTGFSAYRQAWAQLDALYGAEVEVTGLDGGNVLVGVARGVDEDGALRIEAASGMRLIFGGEVSVRLSQP